MTFVVTTNLWLVNLLEYDHQFFKHTVTDKKFVLFWYLFWLLFIITFIFSFNVLLDDGLLFIVYACSKSQLLFDMESNITVASVVVLENEVVVVYSMCFTSWLFVIQKSELRWCHCFLLVSEDANFYALLMVVQCF